MAVDLSTYTSVLIDESMRLEPCHAEVCADQGTDMRIVYEASDFSVATTNTTTLFGLRTILNQRLGFITTNTLNMNDLKAKALEAQQIASLSPESPFHQIAPKTDSGGGYFEIVDPAIENIQPKELLRFAELLVSEVKKDERVAIDRAEVSVSVSNRVVHNTNGVFQKMKQATVSWFVMGMAKSGDEVTSFDYDGNSTCSFQDIEKKIIETAKEFSESVLGSLGAKSASSYKGPVLLHPSAVGDLIVGVVGFNINARAQQDGMSKWKNALNTSVAHASLSITENPLDESRVAGWMPFDREGVLTKNHDVIKNGKLVFTAHNSFTAKRGKVLPTGNATGSSRSIPGIGLSNLTVGTGSTPTEQLFKKLGKGLVLKRFSGNADPVSGQFSGIAKNSHWIEGGARQFATKELMVSGNMFELLNDIIDIGSQSYDPMGSLRTPFILVNNMSVTGS
jgi:PmbA protein